MKRIILPRWKGPAKTGPYASVHPGRWSVRALAALVGAALTLALGAGVAQAADGTIEGVVTNHKVGNLGKIEVTATRENGGGFGETETEPDGKYAIASLPEGTYAVVFTDRTEEFETTEDTALVEGGKVSKGVDAEMVENGSLAGRVTNASNGAPLSGVSVQLYHNGSEYAVEEATNGNGEYLFEHLAPGEYTADFEEYGNGLEPTSVSFTIAEGVQHMVNVQLHEGGKISGTVTDAYSHAVLEEVDVYAYARNGGEYVGSGSARTNSKGEFTITGLPSGSYKVSFAWGKYSETEEKEVDEEKIPQLTPRYIFQYFNDQPTDTAANTVSVSEGATSSGINAAMVPAAPHNTAAPTVSGTPKAGSLLTCASGSWTGEGELPLQQGWPLTNTFSFQWLREGTAISGATLDSYLVQSADQGHGLVCEVSATNRAGHETAKSASVMVAKPVPKVRTSATKLVLVNGRVRLGLFCSEAPCAGMAEATVRVAAKHHRKKTVVLARASYSLAEGKKGTVVLHLSGAGAKALVAKHDHASAKLVITVKEGKTVERGVAVAVSHRK